MGPAVELQGLDAQLRQRHHDLGAMLGGVIDHLYQEDHTRHASRGPSQSTSTLSCAWTSGAATIRPAPVARMDSYKAANAGGAPCGRG
jgi:hypothetical protein